MTIDLSFLPKEEQADYAAAIADAARRIPQPKRKRAPEPHYNNSLSEPEYFANGFDSGNAGLSVEGIEDDWKEGDDPGFIMIGEAKIENVPVIIERLLPAEGITFLAGQSGVGKTFAAILAAVALTTKGEFLGYPVTEQCGVIYIAAEGPATVTPRFMAAIKMTRADKSLPVAIIKDVPNLSDDCERRKFLHKVKRAAKKIEDMFGVRVGMVVIDTIAKAFSMKDENSAAETQSVLDKADEIGRCIGAATLAVAHYGKAQETGIRGSSARRGYGESVIALTGDRNELDGTCKNRKAAHTKNRTGDEGPLGDFTLIDVDLGTDDNGKPLKSGYLQFSKTNPCDISAPRKEPKGDGYKCLMKAIHTVWGGTTTIQPFPDDHYKSVMAVSKALVEQEFMASYAAEKGGTEEAKQRTKERAFARAIQAAGAAGTVHYRDIKSGGSIGEWIWLADEKFSKPKRERDTSTGNEDY